MKKFLKKGLLNLLLTIFFISLSNTSTSYAAESSQPILIATDIVPDAAFTTAIEFAPSYIQTFLDASNITNVHCSEGISCSIGNGYYVYTDQDGVLQRSDIIDFPIIQNNKVVLIIHVFETAQGWGSTASYAYSDMLNQFYGSGQIYQVISYSEDADCILVPVTERCLLTTVIPIPYDISYDTSRSLGTFYSNISPIVTYANGFSINDPTYKILNMDYCLVLQNDETGKQRGLCWAATCATMIRYSTGNRSIESFQIANEMGIGYDAGADSFTMRQVLINHGCTIQYQALNRKAISITEVMHNINNQYPLAMVGTRYNNGYPIAGHAVTIIGYNGSNLIYWNSASGQMTVAAFSASSTNFTTGSLVYNWDRSILIPLP